MDELLTLFEDLGSLFFIFVVFFGPRIWRWLKGFLEAINASPEGEEGPARPAPARPVQAPGHRVPVPGGSVPTAGFPRSYPVQTATQPREDRRAGRPEPGAERPAASQHQEGPTGPLGQLARELRQTLGPARVAVPARRAAPALGLARLLADRDEVRRAIVLSTVLGPPHALRSRWRRG